MRIMTNTFYFEITYLEGSILLRIPNLSQDVANSGQLGSLSHNFFMKQSA